jgi:hypothetical protein
MIKIETLVNVKGVNQNLETLKGKIKIPQILRVSKSKH